MLLHIINIDGNHGLSSFEMNKNLKRIIKVVQTTHAQLSKPSEVI